jgi:hypothetical protein
MNKIKTLAGAMLLLIALLATSTVWAQTAAPTKPTSKEQYTQMLKDKQAQMAKQRADRAAQPRKAKATTTAAKAVKDDPALKAQKEAAQTTTVTRKAKPYVPTEADKKATDAKKMKEQSSVVKNNATTAKNIKTTKPTVQLSPEQKMQQLEKELAFAQNKGYAEKVTKISTELDATYRQALSQAKTKEAKQSILQKWMATTNNPTIQNRLKAQLNQR